MKNDIPKPLRITVTLPKKKEESSLKKVVPSYLLRYFDPMSGRVQTKLCSSLKDALSKQFAHQKKGFSAIIFTNFLEDCPLTWFRQ